MPLYEVTFERYAYPFESEVLDAEFSPEDLNEMLEHYQQVSQAPVYLVTNVYMAEDSEDDEIRVVLGLDLLVEAPSAEEARAVSIDSHLIQEMAQDAFSSVMADLDFEDNQNWAVTKVEESYMKRLPSGAFTMEIPALRRHPAWVCTVLKSKSGKAVGTTSEGESFKADSLAQGLEKAHSLFEEQCLIRM